MAQARQIQNNFTAGELSPRLEGRTDLAKYFNGVLTLENMINWPHGGVYRRPGTRYVAEVKSSANKTRLVSFEFSTTQAYILEFGNLYMRVYRNKGQVQTGSPLAAYELATPYATADLFDLQFAQSADILYVAHQSYAPRKITRTADDAWTITEIDFEDGPYRPEVLTPTITLSAVTGAGITLTASGPLFNVSDHVGALWRIKHDLTPGTPTVTPQGAAGSTRYDYRITSVNANGETLASSAGNTTTGNATLSATNFNRVTWTSIPGAVAYRVYGRTQNKELFIAEVQATTYDDIGDITPNGALPVKDTSEGHWGYVEITAVASTTSATADVKEDLGRVAASVAHREGAWSTHRGFPGTVTLFEERLLWGGSPADPQNVWGSQSADFENHDEGTALDNEAVIYTIGSDQVNVIRWLAPSSALLIGTTAKEFWMRSGDVDEPLTPSSVKARPQTPHGSKLIQPLPVEDALLFVQRAGKKLRELAYVLDVDSYKAPDLTRLAEHITGDGLTQLAYAQEPDSLVYGVRTDGILASLTYLRDEDVIGWSRQKIGGVFGSGDAVVESVATIPHPDGDRDQTWVIVKRTINGATKRFVEYFEDKASEFTSRAWSEFYLDSALPYSGSAATTITGLDHLEGETVGVVGDGAIYTDAVVSSGAITISPAASEVEVGLKYTSTLKTLSPDIPSFGTILGKKQQWTQISVILKDSLGVTINGDQIPFRKSSDPMDAAPPIFSGTKKLSLTGIDQEGRVTITQTQALPLKLLAIVGELSVADI